ncbi:MAG: hypothetical protein BWY99_02464 [Synergistetes bacterium ADurb.BinA166]|nr:MAG: hypothetical protein BWY99_02464 [Synergistetes bacterium ADurb.BinA166]
MAPFLFHFDHDVQFGHFVFGAEDAGGEVVEDFASSGRGFFGEDGLDEFGVEGAAVFGGVEGAESFVGGAGLKLAGERGEDVGVGEEVFEAPGGVAPGDDVLFIAVAEDHVHDEGPAVFVVEVVKVEVASDFLEEDPGDAFFDFSGAGVVFEAFVAEPFDGALDPLPSGFAVLEFGDEVVGHVPAVEVPDFFEAGFELAHPVVELVEFPELVVLLEFDGAKPDGVNEESSEAAEEVCDEDDARVSAGVGVEALGHVVAEEVADGEDEGGGGDEGREDQEEDCLSEGDHAAVLMSWASGRRAPDGDRCTTPGRRERRRV